MIPANIMSESQIRDQLMAIVEAQPDDSRWKDWFTGGNGATLLDMMTALGAFLNMSATTARRESNPLYGKLASTVYAAAALFGYPINRRQCATFELTVNNPGNSYFNNRTDPIGFFNGSPISLAESQQIPEGQSTLVCVLGQWHSESYTSTEATEYFEYEVQTTVDMPYVCNQNVQLYVNEDPKTLTPFIEDLMDNSYVLRTYIDKLSVMFGGTSAGVPIKKGDVVRVDWLEIKATASDSGTAIYDASTWQGVDPLLFVNVVTTRRETPQDSLYKVTRLLPTYYASKRRMINPNDHEAVLTSQPGMLSSKYAYGICSNNPLFNPDQSSCEATGGHWEDAADGDCCTKVMSYLRHDLTEMSYDEEESLYDILQKRHMIAGNYLIFRAGHPVTVVPKLAVLIDPDYKDVDNLNIYIQNLVNSQCYILGGAFKVGKLVRDINALSGVRYCYIIRPRRDMQLSWLGYFNPGELEVIVTTKESDMLQYGGEEGGYLPYTQQVSGYVLKAWSEQSTIRMGEQVKISGYLTKDSKVIAGAVIGVTFDGVLTNVTSGTDGTFTVTLTPNSIGTKAFEAKITLDDTAYTSSGSMTVTDNVYKLTLVGPDDAKVGDTISVSGKLTKNGVPLPNVSVRLTIRSPITVKTDDNGEFVYPYTITAIQDVKAVAVYTDPYNVTTTAQTSWGASLRDLFKLTVSIPRNNYLVGEIIAVSCTLLNNGVGMGGATLAFRPILDGVEQLNVGRSVTLDATGNGTVYYPVAQSDVEALLEGANIHYEVGGVSMASAQVMFSVALNPNGSWNGMG